MININRITKKDLENSSDINMLGEFDDMNNWNVEDTNEMNKWIEFLEKYDVYFSAPLDIDFLMIKNFKKEYLNILEDNEGPYIKGIGKIENLKDEDKLGKKYSERLQNDIKSTLKDKSTSGNTFTREEKELMIWYKYFFLTRGKPTTHRVALLNIEEKKLIENMPDVFKKIKSNIESKLG